MDQRHLLQNQERSDCFNSIIRPLSMPHSLL